ncbi:formate--tetrahydrofolate ligase [Flavobacteriaceae bacterium UJ101]|nr:formate--tetrahydrofolate ligase [Flavobacteriaceae bacterium UJ101]
MTKVKSDLEIATAADIKPIHLIAKKIGITEDQLELYGKYKAKLPLDLIDESKIKQNKLILVTALSPTPAGEGKTTTSIGLTEALNRIGKKATVVLREPSLGPVFGMKGGAAGGGYSQVIPMEDINLHFTGDFSAIEKANNLLSALIDNNIQSKTRNLGIDPRTILWKRVMDMNDRALRNITIGLGGTANGIPRQDGFNITPASEIMAILCLSNDIEDLKERIGNILIGFKFDKTPVYAKDLNGIGAMTLLLKDAIKPNLVQTLEGNPAILHGGPFANIAQGTNSIIATKMGLSLSEYVVTEAGFGSDLGAEKFMNIKCRAGNLNPKTWVIVATIRALKYHGGVSLKELNEENVEAVSNGFKNLERHIENAKLYGVTPVISINRFSADTEAEIAKVQELCAEMGVKALLSEGWAKGGEGCEPLAKAVVEVVEKATHDFQPLYPLDKSLEEKIEMIAQKTYGAKDVAFSALALRKLKQAVTIGLGDLPICMAKTQKSFSDEDKKIGKPEGFTINIRDVEIASGAGFIIPIAGKMMRMPGLPATPAAEHMDIDKDGVIKGLS